MIGQPQHPFYKQFYFTVYAFKCFTPRIQVRIVPFNPYSFEYDKSKTV